MGGIEGVSLKVRDRASLLDIRIESEIQFCHTEAHLCHTYIRIVCGVYLVSRISNEFTGGWPLDSGMTNAFYMGMTKLQTINLIKGLGLAARWNSEYHEFVINYRRGDSRRTELSDYHTDDSDDAIATARAMVGRVED